MDTHTVRYSGVGYSNGYCTVNIEEVFALYLYNLDFIRMFQLSLQKCNLYEFLGEEKQ